MGEIDYDVIYNSYDEVYRDEQFAKYRIALSLLQDLGGIILDAGCGTGFFYEFLRKRVDINRFEYFGIDKSLNMLKKAKKKICVNAHLIMACVEFMPFRDQVFSYIFSFTVFHEVDIDKALREIERLSSDRCSVVVSMLKKVRVKVDEILKKCSSRYSTVFIGENDDSLKDLIIVFRVC
ncbi:MAG: hypothetical protein DRJ38_08515 [Thermoprotei archaeon]|nr:MAG: hypothetical protein DRJ38_08515 [Thermoprotei archaeon]